MSAEPRDLVAIGASAGGVEAIQTLLGMVPGDFAATLFVTIHRSPTHSPELARALGRRSRIRVCEPADGERFVPARAYVAPADQHMLVFGDRIFRHRTAKVHHSRPAIDPMFESLAESHGGRVIGVLLTGNLSDGVEGLIAIKARHGLSLAQDPSEALYPSMPRSAILHDHVDLVFLLRSLPGLLAALARGATVSEAVGSLTSDASTHAETRE